MHLEGGAADDERAVDQGMAARLRQILEMARGVGGEAVADGEQADGAGFAGQDADSGKKQGGRESRWSDCWFGGAWSHVPPSSVMASRNC
jgi:hypothetical protein